MRTVLASTTKFCPSFLVGVTSSSAASARISAATEEGHGHAFTVARVRSRARHRMDGCPRSVTSSHPAGSGSDFRWLLASSWTSNLGDGIALSAAPLLIASLTSSPLLVAVGAMMQFLPWLLFGLFAGSVADHHDRRRLVMLADGSRAVIVLALVVFLVTGHATVWMVLATAFLYGTAEVFADTAGTTLLPMLVRSPDLGIGNARLQAGYLVGNQLAGPALGAFLFAIGSFWPFVVQILCVALARAPHLADRPHPGARAGTGRAGGQGAPDPRGSALALGQPAGAHARRSSSSSST